MRLEVKRLEKTPEYTRGELWIDDAFFCYTLEDPIRDKKIYGETAIPEGKYRVIIDFSTNFQKFLPHILDVPNFTGVRFHGGNTVADTLGCILIGFKKIKGGIAHSASKKFMELLAEGLKGGKVWVSVS